MCHILGNVFSLSLPPSALVKMPVLYFYLKAEPPGKQSPRRLGSLPRHDLGIKLVGDKLFSQCLLPGVGVAILSTLSLLSRESVNDSYQPPPPLQLLEAGEQMPLSMWGHPTLHITVSYRDSKCRLKRLQKIRDDSFSCPNP